jgi:hypothetical protein
LARAQFWGWTITHVLRRDSFNKMVDAPLHDASTNALSLPVAELRRIIEQIQPSL